MESTERFSRAIEAMDAANAEDPRQVSFEGKPWPQELLYARRMSLWLDRLQPQASETLRLAARGHDHVELVCAELSNEAGVRDLPVLGHLFRYTNRTHNKTNLMVFLRPVIVRNANDAGKVSNPRYEHIIGLQKSMAPEHKLLLPDVDAPTLKLAPGLATNATQP